MSPTSILMINPANYQEIVFKLTQCLVNGKIPSNQLIPVLQRLLENDSKPPCIQDVIDQLRPLANLVEVQNLINQLRESLLRDAYRCFCSRQYEPNLPINTVLWPDFQHLPSLIPIGWGDQTPSFDEVRETIKTLHGWAFLKTRNENSARIQNVIFNLKQKAVKKFRPAPTNGNG